MCLQRLQRIKNIGDAKLECLAVKINNRYCIVYKDRHKRLYDKIFKILEKKYFEYLSLKKKLKNIENDKQKEEQFKRLQELSYFIGA